MSRLQRLEIRKANAAGTVLVVVGVVTATMLIAAAVCAATDCIDFGGLGGNWGF